MTTSKKKDDPNCLAKPTVRLQCISESPVRLSGRGVSTKGDLVVVLEDEAKQLVAEGTFAACAAPKTKPTKPSKQEDE